MSDRLDLFSQILRFASAQHIKLARFWAGFVETTRFKLGESIKDIKIPFAVDSETTQIIDLAFKDLFEFLKRRSEAQFKIASDHSIDDFVGETRLAPKTYQIRFFRKDTAEYWITLRCMMHDPLLDAGIFETWLGSKNSGQALLNAFKGIYQKALTEEYKSEHVEKTAYIQHLALLKHLTQAKSIIKKSTIKGLTYEQIDITFGNVLYVMVDVVLEFLFEQIRSKPVPPPVGHSMLLLSSTCQPVSLISIKQSILRAKVNPYNISQENSNILDAVYRDVSQKDTELDYVYPTMFKKVIGNTKLRNAILEEATVLHLRKTILDFLIEFDNPAVALPSRLRTIIQDQVKLFEFAFNAKEVDALADNLRKQLKQDSKEERRMELLAEIDDLVRFIQKGSSTRKSQLAEHLIEQMIFRYLTYKIDLYLDPFTTEALNLLENRQLKLNISQLKQDYDSGRLYRISTDEKPSLKEFSEHFEGQLFIDLKDFTKRTQFSKEIVMADFLGSEFYKPILEAAKKYFAHVQFGGKTIRLVNLLGDAVIFCGNIEYLVYLSQDIQNIFKEYRNKLKATSPINLETELKQKLENKLRRDTERITEALNKTTQIIKDIKDGISQHLKKNYTVLTGQFETQLNQEIMKLENEFLELDGKSHDEASEEKRFDLLNYKNSVSQKLTDLRGLHKQFVEQFAKMPPEKQTILMGRFFFRDKIREIANFEEYLDTLQKRRTYLKYEYEREIKRIEGFGIEAGLFISYGSAAEMIVLRDEVWGEQKVDIAETINESARGTARNSMIKKMLEERLSEHARLRGKDLASPFSVYVENIYSYQLAPQHNHDLTQAFLNSDVALGEKVLLNMYHEGLKQIRDQVQNPEEQGERLLTLFSDIYNEGAALSEDALNAFLKETSTTRLTLRKKVPVRKFRQEILESFVFLTDTCQFVLNLDAKRPAVSPLIFRYAGQALFRGFENRGAIGVYELLKPDSSFYRLLLHHHIPDWLEEVSEQNKS